MALATQERGMSGKLMKDGKVIAAVTNVRIEVDGKPLETDRPMLPLRKSDFRRSARLEFDGPSHIALMKFWAEQLDR